MIKILHNYCGKCFNTSSYPRFKASICESEKKRKEKSVLNNLSLPIFYINGMQMWMFAQSNKQITAFVAFFSSFLSVKSSFSSDGLIFYANLYIWKTHPPFSNFLERTNTGLSNRWQTLTDRLFMVSLSSQANMRESAANILQIMFLSTTQRQRLLNAISSIFPTAQNTKGWLPCLHLNWGTV